jgi:tetratricopeptide (TPR) repeat protein
MTAFYGRKAELQHLHAAWQQVTKTNQPQVITIVAETGLGKSRLVQELYHTLTTDPMWDPPVFNYWPDAFQSPSMQLQVNPEFTHHRPNGPPMFLWLGMRWSDQHERNLQSSLALPTLLEQMNIHARLFTDMLPFWQRSFKTLHSTIQEQLHVEKLIEIAMDKFVPFGDIIFGIGKTLTKSILADSARSYAESSVQASKTLSDHLLVLFRQLCSGIQPIPIILWLDDAQWMDAESEQFCHNLFQTALDAQWPILMIATHWPREWHERHHTDFLRLHSSFELLKAQHHDLHALLHSQLPGLTATQYQLIVDKSDGNFLTLSENIGQLLTTKRYFVNQDTHGELTSAGMNNISTWQSQRQHRIAQRFDEFNDDVKDLLARASQLGSLFLVTVLRQFASHRQIDDAESVIQQCITPLTVVTERSPHFHEFRDRGYFLVANKYFHEWLHEQDNSLLATILDEQLSMWIQETFNDLYTHNLESPSPRSLLRLLNHEQLAILEIALQQFTDEPQQHIKCLTVASIIHAQSYQWDTVRKHADAFDRIDWNNSYVALFSSLLMVNLAEAIESSGRITTAALLWDHAKQLLIQETTSHTPSTGYLMVLTRIGNNALLRRDFLHAQQMFREIIQFLDAQPFHDEPLVIAMTYAHAYNDLGHVFRVAGDYNDALAAFQHALQLLTPYRTQPLTLAQMRELADTLNNIGRIHRYWKDYDTSLEYYVQGLTLYRQFIPITTDYNDRHFFCIALNNVARIYRETHRYQDAIELFHESIALIRTIVTKRGLPDDNRQLAVELSGIGRTYLAIQDYSNALISIMESLDIRRAIIRSRGVIEDYRGLVLTLTYLSQTELAMGHLFMAQDHIAEAIRHATRICEQSPIKPAQHELAEAQQLLTHIQHAIALKHASDTP